MEEIYNQVKNLLFLDIETVSGVGSYEELNDRLKPLWNKKSARFQEQEGKTAEELFFEKAGILAEFGKVVVIGLGYFAYHDGKLEFRVKSLANDDEQKLLQEFAQIVNSFNQRELRYCAHNGKEFDFPYLCRRMLVNGMDIPTSLNVAGKKPWEVPFVDTMELWKFGDYKSFTSLELLAALFNIPTSKDDIDGSQVNHVYYVDKDLPRIAKYCKNDVIVTARLYLKMLNQPYLTDNMIAEV